MEGREEESGIARKYPPFSVAISVYQKDNATFFDRALESITSNQTVKPDEVVLIVDGPVPNKINNVIGKYECLYPAMFHIVRCEKNSGLGNALKLAVEKAKYALVARMDSDDVSVPNRFEQELNYFIEHPETDIIGGDITEFVGEESNIVGRRVVPKSNMEIREYMKSRCAMNHVSVMYKKSAVQAAGGYQDWFWNEDYYLWIRMQLNRAVFANTGTVLVNVRVGGEMYQRRGGKKYFQSELGLQKLMLEKGIISGRRFFINVLERLILQVLMPNKLRGFLFQKLAREK